MLGSTENTLGRSRIVETLKQQWPDQELHQASWYEAGSWEADDDQFEGSFADEEEEQAFNLAGSQLNKALASGRYARRTLAQARAIVVTVIRMVQTRKVSQAGKGKSEGQGKNRNRHGPAPGQSSNAPTSQAGRKPHKPMPPSTRPCLKCGSRDHEPGKCPKNQEHRSYMAHVMNFTALCLG